MGDTGIECVVFTPDSVTDGIISNTAFNGNQSVLKNTQIIVDLVKIASCRVGLGPSFVAPDIQNTIVNAITEAGNAHESQRRDIVYRYIEALFKKYRLQLEI